MMCASIYTNATRRIFLYRHHSQSSVKKIILVRATNNTREPEPNQRRLPVDMRNGPHSHRHV